MTSSTEHIVDIILRRAALESEKPAYTFLLRGERPVRTLTYASLDLRARAIGAHLRRFGQTHERALMAYSPGLEFIEALLGCFYAGVIAVPATLPQNRQQGLARLEAISHDCSPAVVLSTREDLERLAEGFPGAFGGIPAIATDDIGNDEAAEWRLHGINPADIALLQYSSGSTASPKGIMVSHSNIVADEMMIQEACSHTEASTFVGWLPFFHDMGLFGNIIQPLFIGAHSILMSPLAFLQKPVRWLRAISRYRAHTSGGPNFGYEYCVRRIEDKDKTDLDLSSWKIAFNGAEKPRRETIKRFTAAFAQYGFQEGTFYPCYGLAEAVLFVSGRDKSARPEIMHTTSFHDAAGDGGHGHRVSNVSSGQTWLGQRIAIVHPQDHVACADGCIGEIWIQGPNITKGYWRQPDVTDATFQGYLADGGDGPFLRTGDLGYLQDGELYVTGRLKDLIILRGQNYHPEDIEAAVEGCDESLEPGQCAAFNLDVDEPAKSAGERLAVILETGRGLDGERFLNSLCDKAVTIVSLKFGIIINELIVVKRGAIPKTSSGKIQRFRCRELFLAGKLAPIRQVSLDEAGFEAEDADNREFLRETILNNSGDSRSALVGKLLQERLRRLMLRRDSPIALDSSLIQNGLDSLRAAELKQWIENVIGASVSIAELFEARSVRALADLITMRLSSTDVEAAQDGLDVNLPVVASRLSYGQEALLFEYEKDPSGVENSISVALELQGPVDGDRLSRVFSMLVSRHPQLLTVFRKENDEWRQEFRDSKDPLLEVVNATAWSNDECARQVSDHANAPFDLNERAVRFVFFRRGSQSGVLLVVIHHILTDLSSLEMLLKEVADLYSGADGAAAEGDRVPSGASYSHFVAWQRRFTESPSGRKSLQFWQEKLAGRNRSPRLPFSRRSPAGEKKLGGSHYFTLDRDTTDRIRQFAAGEEVTTYVVLLAAYAALLTQYTRENGIVIGTSTFGRPDETFAGVLGYFTNIVALPLAVDPRASFRQVVAQARDLVRGALDHQYYPFSLLVQRLGAEQSSDRDPLVRYAFTFGQAKHEQAVLDCLHPDGAVSLAFGPIAATSFALDRQMAPFDVTLMVLEREERLLASFCHLKNVVEAEAISVLAESFCGLLPALISHPEMPLSQVGMSNPSGQVQSRETMMAPTGNSDSLVQRFERWAVASPEAVALLYEDHHVGYGELDRRAGKLGQYLIQRGVGPETVVAVYCPRGVQMVVAILGVSKAGGVYCPIDITCPEERLQFILNDAKAGTILTVAELAGRCSGLSGDLVLLDREWDWIEAAKPSPAARPACLDNLAYVIYTSGSTGMPKGVGITNKNTLRLFDCSQQYYGFGSSDTWILYHSISFDFSVWEMWGALSYGGKLTMLDHASTREPEKVYKHVIEEHVTVLNQTPSAFYNLLPVICGAAAGMAETSLRFIIFGGEALKYDLIKPWFRDACSSSARLVNMYGITETTVHTTFRQVEAPGSMDSAGSAIGQALADMHLQILNSSHYPLPDYALGEIGVSGSGLARGYYGRPALTAERFIPDACGTTPGLRLYLTGDSAYRKPKAKDFVYLGRIDRQVKIRGHRIEPGEVEMAIRSHEEVSWAVVVVAERPDGDNMLTAYLVCSRDLTVSALRSHLVRLIPEYMIPAKFVWIESVPVNENGKVDLAQLASGITLLGSGREYAPPRNQAERTLVRIWEEVLSADSVGIDDNYFELGGDSIRSIQIVSRANSHGLSIGLSKLLTAQTIRGLCDQLLEQPAAGLTTWCEPFAFVSDEDQKRLPDDVEDAYPVCSLLQGLMFHSQFSDDYQIYVTTFHVRATWDASRLREAIEATVKRHSYLRSSIDSSNCKEPLQLVHAAVEIDVDMEDIRHMAANEQVTYLREWFDARRWTRIEWNRAPLVRFDVHRRTDHSFQITSSEPYLDGWCVALLFHEIFDNYLSLLRSGEVLQDAPTAISQRHLVQLERESLADPRCSRFWSDYLKDCPESLFSRVNYKQSVTQLLHDRKTSIIPDHTVARLEALALRAGASLRTVFLAGYAHLLAILLDQQDILLGVMLNGRPEDADGDQVIGAFLNTVPFRIAIKADESWVQYVHRVFSTELQILPYRRFPFAEIKKLCGENVSFDSVFNFTYFHSLESLREQADFEILDVYASEQTFFPLTAHFNRCIVTSQMEFVLDYDCRHISRAQIEVIAAAYLASLELIANEGDGQAEVERVSSIVREKLFSPCPSVETPKIAKSEGASVLHLIDQNAIQCPHAIALVEGDESVTYRQLRSRAGALAVSLIETFGVGSEDVVGLHARHSINAIVGMIAVLKAGAAYVPIDEDCPPARMEFIASDCRLKCVLSEETLADRVEAFEVPVIRLDRFTREAGPAEIARLERIPRAAESLAYVIYTSGSTGTPKGVGVQHDSLANLAIAAIQEYAISPGDRILQFCTLEFDISVEEIFMCLAAGATLVLRPRDLLESYDRFYGYCAQEAITCLNIPTAVWNDWVGEIVASQRRFDLAIRLMIIAGEQMRPELALQWKNAVPSTIRLVNTYGPTEATVKATMYAVDTDEQGLADLRLPGSPIGSGFANARVSVLDKKLRSVGPGIYGELYIGGIGVARAYRNRPRLTAERFVPEPSASLGSRRYRTGDIGYHRGNGNLHFVGRLDLQVKIRGFRVELEEVEAALQACAGVLQASVIAVQSEGKATVLKAYVRLQDCGHPGSASLDKQLRMELETRLPYYMIPSSFIFVESLPTNLSGKVDRNKVRLLDASSTEAVGASRVKFSGFDLLTEIVASTCAYCLQLDLVKAEDDFFSLGGNSLAAMRVASRLRAAVACEVSARDVLENPQIEELAKLLGSRLAVNTDADTDTRSTCEFDNPASFAQERLWMAEHLSMASAAYNIPAAITIRGPFNLSAFEQSVREVQRRHTVLKTRLVLKGGRLVQEYDDALNVAVQLVDFSQIAKSSYPSAIGRCRDDLAGVLFSLHDDPFIRMALFSPGTDEHQLFIVIHHIVADAWSINLLIGECLALYADYARGCPSRLSEPPIQYADYARRQKQKLSGSYRQRLLDYWLKALADMPDNVELPLDYERPAFNDFKGTRYYFTVDGGLAGALDRLSRKENVTRFMVLLMAYKVLLHRHSGQTDIVVGAPVSNREWPDTETLIGLFVNQIIVRTNLSGSPTYRELLARIKSGLLTAFEHRDLPFEDIVTALRPRRGAGFLSLVQTVFAYRDQTWENFRIHGLELEFPEVHNHAAKYDLEVQIWPNEANGLQGYFEYNIHLFKYDTIVNLAAHYIDVLREIVANLDLPAEAPARVGPAQLGRLGERSVETISTAGVTNAYE